MKFPLFTGYNGKGTNERLRHRLQTDVIFIEVTKMELAEIRNELEKSAKKLVDFRGSL